MLADTTRITTPRELLKAMRGCAKTAAVRRARHAIQLHKLEVEGHKAGIQLAVDDAWLQRDSDDAYEKVECFYQTLVKATPILAAQAQQIIKTNDAAPQRARPSLIVSDHSLQLAPSGVAYIPWDITLADTSTELHLLNRFEDSKV